MQVSYGRKWSLLDCVSEPLQSTYAARTGQVADVRVDERTRDDAPPVECLPVRPIRPPYPGVGVGIEVPSISELLLGGLLKLVRVHGERGYCTTSGAFQLRIYRKALRTHVRQSLLPV